MLATGVAVVWLAALGVSVFTPVAVMATDHTRIPYGESPLLALLPPARV